MRVATRPFRLPFSVAVRGMASTSGDGSGASKLVFAPSGSQHPHRADQYTANPPLLLNSLSPNPFTQFHTWFASARAHPVPLAESVCLSTASLPSGRVSSRFVYLKELDSRGFVIYSNWGTSRKAQDVATNGQAALAFWWREVERQVRVEGKVERLTREESQRYFDLRARGSKIGAWASRQSEVLPEDAGEAMATEGGEGKGKGDGEAKEAGQDVPSTSEGGRRKLDHWVREVEARFADTPDDQIPCPDFWGGVRVVPDLIEFWQGRDSRLHDRFQYTKVAGGKKGDEGGSGEWKIERLSP